MRRVLCGGGAQDVNGFLSVKEIGEMVSSLPVGSCSEVDLLGLLSFHDSGKKAYTFDDCVPTPTGHVTT